MWKSYRTLWPCSKPLSEIQITSQTKSHLGTTGSGTDHTAHTEQKRTHTGSFDQSAGLRGLTSTSKEMKLYHDGNDNDNDDNDDIDGAGDGDVDDGYDRDDDGDNDDVDDIDDVLRCL
ncbi:hypothetical protein ElyMa_003320400 [Elysia marginata]|uniref:Uncharacterized protein n=1 Tax=Elysia marginata TaxID=1093978 RepID=A0AAV4JD18_9GAST|nr:hypothetical protein ElyMa_003320400 [Elysia marginata]